MKYFKADEFNCKCGLAHPSPMNRELLDKLDEAREEAGIPFVITSGFRCPHYNERLKARGYKVASDSSHMKGLAVDIAVSAITKNKIRAALENHFKRIGIAENYIHVDVDPDKPAAVWNY